MTEAYRAWRSRVRKAFRAAYPYLSNERFEIMEDGSVMVKSSRKSVVAGSPLRLYGYEAWKV